jgi:cystathionine beta-lyase
VALVSATKTFNLAGAPSGLAVIPNSEVRRAFVDACARCFFPIPNRFSMAAAEAAYRGGASWLDGLMEKVAENHRTLSATLEAAGAPLRCTDLEGTYLAWIDCRRTGFSDEEIDRRIREQAHLRLSPGAIFGTGGTGFQRMNLATTTDRVTEAARRLVRALPS